MIEQAKGSTTLSDIQSFKHHNDEMGKILGQEERYWKQRAKTRWPHEGDRNTHYFHAMASVRRRMNRISKLQTGKGESNSNESCKKWDVKCHFTTLNSVLTPINSVFAPMVSVKMGCHFNNSMFFY